MNVAEAVRETGLNDAQIRGAVAAIRGKGYPVVSTSVRRTLENDFRIAASREEYGVWRERIIADIAVLRDLLAQCDRAAEHCFGKLDKQGDLI